MLYMLRPWKVLEFAGNRGEFGRHVGADQSNRRNDRDSNQGRDQAILEGSNSTTVITKADNF
jgi:hypothetical protein